MSLLSQIQDVVQKFAETASAALNVDVEVIDDDRMRVAGTGKTKDKIGTKIMEKGLINRTLFKDQRKILVERPGYEENCTLCPRYQNCEYKIAVYAAIIYENRTVGVIGIAALYDEQKQIIANNNYAMLNFVEKIADLISTKVHENQILRQVKTYGELMNTTIDNIDKGIMVLNNQFEIIEINQYLSRKFLVDKDDIVGEHIGKLFPKLNLIDEKTQSVDRSHQEICCLIKGKQVYLISNFKPIIINKHLEVILCLIEDYKDLSQLNYEFSEKMNMISLKDIIGESQVMTDFKNKVKKAAVYDSTVLLTGETGTGKELFARALHYESNRKKQPFIPINCGAMPETLIESELFGYEKGSFTGADHMGKHGKFYFANGGTIFLDEIETMPIYLQPKLLRVIERKEIDRIGSSKSIPIDVRIVSASNVDLEQMVANGQFREDLYHRLHVVNLEIPTLRDREKDIFVLSQHFIERYSDRFRKNVQGLSDEVKELFAQHSWKGNVRELQNTIEYAINMVQGEIIEIQHLPTSLTNPKKRKGDFRISEVEPLEEVEKKYLKRALDIYGWGEEGRLKAAKKLGISRATIYRKMKKFQLVEGD